MAELELDAIVLADDPLSSVKVGGLPAYERAVRVAHRVGASRVFVVEKGPRDALVAWRGTRNCPLLVIRGDQLVDVALLGPLVAAMPVDGVAIAIDPLDRYAGAYIAAGIAAPRAAVALASGENSAAFIGAADAARISTDESARHPIATPADLAAAEQLLVRTPPRSADDPVTRGLFRPISERLTQMLLATPITPNQVWTICVVMVALGCGLTALPGISKTIAGAAVMLIAAHLHRRDAEIARIKLLPTQSGVWLEMIVHELSTAGYVTALGLHCHAAFGGGSWIAGTAIGVASLGWAVYCLYFNVIVAVGSGDSDDYAARFEIAPGSSRSAVRLAPVRAPAHGPVQAIASYALRRDFIAWIALLLAVLHVTYVAFWLLVITGIVAALVMTIDHLQLRKLLRSIADAGQTIEAPRAA